MGLDVATSALTYFLFCFSEILFFIAIPMIVFKLQKKDLKYEFRHRIIPNQKLNKKWWLRIIDILIGIVIGSLFFYFGNFLIITIKKVVTENQGEDYYNEATEGSVNTSPPPPANPSPYLIWTLIISGVVIMFLFVAFSEEFCFRGIILKEFGHISKILGILLSSFFFMLFHLFPFIVPWKTFLTFWLYYFSFGVILSIITVIQKGDLITAIFAHATFNSILWVLKYVHYLN